MKTVEETLKRTGEVVDQLRPIDDTFMQKLGEDRDFCEEMLRVILNKPNLKVISNTTQKSIHNIDTRSVTVDVKCEDEDGTEFGVEVQKANDDDHQKRVRYNGSCIQVQSLRKGAKFKDLPDVCMVFISETDFLERGKAIYHIDRTIRETGEVISNGYSEIYVNAQIDDGSDLAEYMKIFKSSSVCNSEKFPIICDLTDYYKNGKGRAKMCTVVEEAIEKRIKDKAVKDAVEMIKDGCTNTFIKKYTSLTDDEINTLRISLSL